MLPYTLIPATSAEVPILVSVPHCGTEFPDELVNQYKDKHVRSPDDTDWFVNRLYDFAPSLGITMISAVYSRWVIDLNRDPQSKPLYSDGRIITGLCPTTTFAGEPLYQDDREAISQHEIDRRLKTYYWPYHQKIEEQLQRLKSRFGKVLLWDCHSIRQVVPTIQQEKFPDLILGSVDGTSASEDLKNIALRDLRSGPYALEHNQPFKGGFITRFFGKPDQQQHALQLEMTKVNYMDATETKYDEAKAGEMQKLLSQVLRGLADQLTC